MQRFPSLSSLLPKFSAVYVTHYSGAVREREMEGKGAHAKGSRPRSTAALGVCGAHSRCRQKAVCVFGVDTKCGKVHSKW